MVSVNRSLLFKEYLDKCSMIDIGFVGLRFTWTNRREVQALIRERIDRYFVNPNWCLLYPEGRVTHLTRCHSDHCPMLLEMRLGIRGEKKRPFRFQSFWLLDATFLNIVSQAWGGANYLVDAIDNFTKKAMV